MIDNIRQKLENQFGKLCDVDLLQPADIFLETAGEGLRTRLFMTQSHDGTVFCLRPEFTIPICLSHLKSSKNQASNYAYLGDVFRQNRAEGSQYLQAGAELIAGEHAVDDILALQGALALIPDELHSICHLRIGDQALFEALLASLDIPKALLPRFAKAFGHKGQVAALLRQLVEGEDTILPDEISKLVKSEDHKGLVNLISLRMEQGNLPSSGGRQAEDIADRLLKRAQIFSSPVSEDAINILKTYLEIDVDLKNATQTLKNFAKSFDIEFGDSLHHFSNLCQEAPALGEARFDADFGRAMDYYSGIVFEVVASNLNLSGPLVFGGRYDGLFEILGAQEPIPAVGFAAALDRIELALREIRGLS